MNVYVVVYEWKGSIENVEVFLDEHNANSYWTDKLAELGVKWSEDYEVCVDLEGREVDPGNYDEWYRLFTVEIKSPTHEAAPVMLKLLEDMLAEANDDTTEKGVTLDGHFDRRIRGVITTAKGEKP